MKELAYYQLMSPRSYKSEMVQNFLARVKVVAASFMPPKAVYLCIPMCLDDGVAFGVERGGEPRQPVAGTP